MDNNDHSSQRKELVEKSQGKLSTMSTGNLLMIAVGITLYYAYQSWLRDKGINANKHNPLPHSEGSNSEGSIPFSGHDSICVPLFF